MTGQCSTRGGRRLSAAEVAAGRAAARQWHIDHKPYFDALYGVDPKRLAAETIAANRAATRQWRIDNKPFFDALYGAEQCCPACGQVVR